MAIFSTGTDLSNARPPFKKRHQQYMKNYISCHQHVRAKDGQKYNKIITISILKLKSGMPAESSNFGK